MKKLNLTLKTLKKLTPATTETVMGGLSCMIKNCGK